MIFQEAKGWLIMAMAGPAPAASPRNGRQIKLFIGIHHRPRRIDGLRNIKPPNHLKKRNHKMPMQKPQLDKIMNNTRSNKTCPAARCASWSAGITIAALLALSGGNAFAAPFTPGNLVVERLGNGTQTLSTTGNTIFFDEYTTAGTLVQSIGIVDGNSIPGSNPMIEAGTGGTTGSITLSPDGQTLCFPGYAAVQPQTSAITSATAATVPRAIGTLNGQGVYTRAATSTLAFSGSNIRGAATDGENNFWGAGTASTTTVNAGVYYFGTANAAAEIISGNLRGVNVFNGGLWFTSASSTPGEDIFEFPGEPTAASTPNTEIVFASNDSDYNFAVSPNGTVIYEADDGGFSATFGGIFKWTLSGGTWTRQYNLLNNGTTGTNCFGLTVNWNTPGGPTLFATTANLSSANTLIRVQDTGSANVGATTLAKTAAKQYLRGVVFAPTGPTQVPPGNLVVWPGNSITANAGTTVVLSVTATGTPPLSYYWYQGSVTPADLVSGPPSSTSSLTLANVTGANAGNYIVVVSNNPPAATATSGTIALTVNDPSISAEPANAEGLTDGTTQFSVSASGTGLTYQWYYCDANGDPSSMVQLPGGAGPYTYANGTVLSGATSKTLQFANLQAADFPILPTNFVAVISGTYNTVTSSVVSFYSVASTAILGFWDFNGLTFNAANPTPFIGNGTASLVGGLPPFATTVQDPNDGLGANFPEGQNVPTNNSWGTSSYPVAAGSPTGVDTNAGVQFNVSTLGARNISISYESRVSATASDYQRLTYTTDGAHWSNYPSSSSFNGHSGSGNGGFLPFSYNFTGFPGVDNNPNFAFRIVDQFQSNATYGAGVHGVISNSYVGTANTYAAGGTVTYDMVEIDGDAILNADVPPTITTIANQSTLDSVPITVDFTVTASTPFSGLTFNAQSLNQITVSPGFSFGTTGGGNPVTLTITPNPIADSVDAAPILVTVTDANGLVAATWFDLTLTTQFLPPTNTLVSLASTNMLANKSLSIPFTVGSEHATPPYSGLTYTVSSDNNTLVPNSGITITGVNGSGQATTTNPSVVITPAINQLGVALITVTVNDNNATEAKSTTATFPVIVRPNTNIVFVDYFDYDNSGSLDTIGAGVWGHLSGIDLQMQVNGNGSGDYVTVDTLDNTENLQVGLLGAPYSDTSAGSLYSSFVVNMSGGNMPVFNGTYFAVFNDGTGATGDYESGVYAVTNGAAPGYYRLGIENWAGNGSENFTSVPIFPVDLTPGVNYLVVTRLVLATGISTLWVNPTTNGISSPSVTDNTSLATAAATLYNIGDFELRESGTDAGAVSVSRLRIGTSFDAVCPSLLISNAPPNVIVNWSDPTYGIQSAPSVLGPWTDVSLTPGKNPPFTNTTSSPAALFFRFGQ
jgi:hypothetical protein